MAPTLRKRTPSAIPPPTTAKKPKAAAKSKSTDSAAKSKSTDSAAKSKSTDSAPKTNGTTAAAKPKKGKAAEKVVESEVSAPANSDDNNDEDDDEEEEEEWKNAKSIYEFKANLITGEEISLEKYRGNVLLIVNVASKCGHTSKNYKELVEIDEKYHDKGLRILAFPCNQFKSQEPGDNEQVKCSIEKRNVKFDVFEKIDVNGPKAHTVYKYLRSKQGDNTPIKWNFAKFIVDKEGQAVARFVSGKSPLDLVPELEKYW